MANGANIAAMSGACARRGLCWRSLPPWTSSTSLQRWAAIALLVAGSGAAAACSGDRGRDTATAAKPSAPAYAGDLPPLPRVQYAAARPEPLTRAAYEFAGRHPDVLKQMPCFCGCERNKHVHNGDCFVSGREANGRPQWSPHGIGCAICIDVALLAARMHGEGSTVAAIRAAVEQKYRAEYPTSTPTPPVMP